LGSHYFLLDKENNLPDNFLIRFSAKHAKIESMENNGKVFSQNTHHKQVLWQIWLPLCLGIFFILLLGLLVIFSSTADGVENGKLADISSILLLAPSLLFCFLFFLFLSTLIFGIYKLIGIIPVYSFKIFMYVVIASDFVHLWANRITQPILILQEWIASATHILKFFSLDRKNKVTGHLYE
jgi:hypothetical protein